MDIQGCSINSGQIRDSKFGNLNKLVTKQTTSSAYLMLTIDVVGTYRDGVPVRQTLVRLQRLSDSRFGLEQTTTETHISHEN